IPGPPARPPPSSSPSAASFDPSLHGHTCPHSEPSTPRLRRPDTPAARRYVAAPAHARPPLPAPPASPSLPLPAHPATVPAQSREQPPAIILQGGAPLLRD